ncbi:MAG: hypothetical protein AAGJ86_03530 [Pseudomonadota bacterium]
MTALTLNPRQRHWLRQAYRAGFWFFMIKGLAWMAAPVIFYHFW